MRYLSLAEALELHHRLIEQVPPPAPCEWSPWSEASNRCGWRGLQTREERLDGRRVVRRVESTKAGLMSIRYFGWSGGVGHSASSSISMAAKGSSRTRSVPPRVTTNR